MAETGYREQLYSIGISVGIAFGAYIVGTLLTVGVALGLEAIGVTVLSEPTRRLFLSTVLLQGVAFGGVALLYLRYQDLGLEFVKVRIPTRKDAAVMLAGLVSILGMVVVASLLLTYLGIDTAQNQIMELGQQEPIAFLLLVPLSFLLVGPGEELLFRALIQGTLRESFHPVRAIVLASALFAIIHVFSLSGDGKWVYVGLVFALALVLGATYEYTGNIVVPAVIHGAYNAVQFGMAYIQAVSSV